MYPRPIQQLILLFSKFPTIGPRTSARFVFYLLKASQSEIDELSQALAALREQVHLCVFCFNPFETADATSLCPLCRDAMRDGSLLCIVEKESDIEALEKAQIYKGLYFVLGGSVGMLRKQDLEPLRGAELKERVQNPGAFGIKGDVYKEIIIATNPTTEGEATALYLERLLAPFNIKTARLGRGLPIGGEIEYADEETLRNA